MKAVIYNRDSDQPVGTIELAPAGNAVVKTNNKDVREFIRELKVSDDGGKTLLTAKDGKRYIQALEIYGPTIQVEA